MFAGSVRLAGTLTVSGVLYGQIGRLRPVPGVEPGSTHVTVTESGQVKGQMRADDIAVLGRATGLLDASGGRITLHQTAQVSGHLRYARLQVNGALLDARLERVAEPGPADLR
jgi:cytoskeletal protein CcmA (bactofilin family)